MTIRTENRIRHPHRPRAIGYFRSDFSPCRTRVTEAIRRLARRQGHTLIYIVRLGPDSVPDAIGHVLDIVRATSTTTLIIPDLAHIENHPGRFCDACDLITVFPEQLWMKVGTNPQGLARQPIWLPEVWHSEPDTRLRIADAHRIMQTHLTCNPLDCPRKAAAFALLVETGKLVPATRSPRERAAARGLPYLPVGSTTSSRCPNVAMLQRLLTGLTQAQP
ncbi:hypothetical protein [Nocardia sp. NBC_01329]|uniref:hypothetical protein n=1 Tax=Nocardia sp. NBC_01329 TaxID=2903594 RepID=UPI002E0E8763|nr:hypothetical protein OG405_04340 [Nocardia sp. NBC_01329]